MSERRACSVIDADRKSVRYRSTRDDDAELREKLRLLEEKEDEESLATTAAKRQKTSSLEDKVDKLYALVARAFPDEVMEVEED